MKRREILKMTLASSLAPLLQSQAATMQKPNILFIAIDDLKPNLSCYGDKVAITPNIDKLAAQGTLFLNNHCQWAVCGPSRASIMTGQRPEVNGVMNLKSKMRTINPKLISLPQHFKNNGYETVARGKIYDPRCVAGGRKKDDKESWSLPYNCPHGLKVNGKPIVDAPKVSDDKLTDGKICNESIKLIKQLANKKKPFFIGVGFKKPHLPFIAPQKYWQMYDRSKLAIAPFQEPAKGVKTVHNYHNSDELREYDGVPKKGNIPVKMQKELIHGYYACITYVDNLVGKLLAEIKNSGIANNTIICLWGDHGWHLGDHGLWGKHTTLEQATRSPLIISSPSIKKSNKTTSPTEFIDIYPTLCELANLKTPAKLDGKSIVSIMKNPEVMVKKGAITSFRRKGFGYSFRTKRYRYVEWLHLKNKKVISTELYDYQKDPLEKIDLSKNPKYKDIKNKLAKEMRETGKESCKMLMQSKKG